jgi:lipid-A-disaccharide synthase
MHAAGAVLTEPRSSGGPSVLVVAGEPSGDLHAARVVEAVRRKRPEVQFWGIGGASLRAAGMEILVDAREMAVLGLWEVLKRYAFFRRVFDNLVAAAAARKPDLVLLIDYPGFNLRFAAAARRLGIPVVYYICPQVWAWHRSRIERMAARIDRLLVIFPFEAAEFRHTGLRVDYVGHPLVDEAARERATTRAPLEWPGAPRIALLPGSRRQEIDRILPVMWQAAGLIQRANPHAGFILAASDLDLAEYAHARAVDTAGGPTRYAIMHGVTRQVLAEAAAAFVKSGTSTIEAALMNCPMCIVYKTSPVTYAFGRRLIRVPYLGMANLIAGREAFKEFIQDAATPQALAAGLTPLLADTPERRAALEALAHVRSALGSGGAAERAADAVIEELDAVSNNIRCRR